jgi:hypothetical protein
MRIGGHSRLSVSNRAALSIAGRCRAAVSAQAGQACLPVRLLHSTVYVASGRSVARRRDAVLPEANPRAVGTRFSVMVCGDSVSLTSGSAG